MIILAILALALLKYFLNWSIFDAIESPQGQDTISYMRNVINVIWSYTAGPVTFVWNEVLWPLIQFAWQSFQMILEQGREAANSFN